MSEPTEPKGDCPFCDAPKWHVCEHFTGYVRGDQVFTTDDVRRRRKDAMRPKLAEEVAVDTGVSVRAYRKIDQSDALDAVDRHGFDINDAVNSEGCDEE